MLKIEVIYGEMGEIQEKAVGMVLSVWPDKKSPLAVTYFPKEFPPQYRLR
jgi:hypothetical protein